MAKAVLAQGQSSEQAAKGTTLDLATSKETVGGATTDLWASAAAPENFPNQTTSVEALGETEPTPPASHTNKQTTGASPLEVKPLWSACLYARLEALAQFLPKPPQRWSG